MCSDVSAIECNLLLYAVQTIVSGASLKHQICIMGCKVRRAIMNRSVPVECFWLTEDLDWVVIDVKKVYDWLRLI